MPEAGPHSAWGAIAMGWRRPWVIMVAVAAALFGGFLTATGSRAKMPGDGGKAGDSRPAAGSQPRDGGLLTIGLYAAPTGIFNPILFEQPYDGAVINLIYEGLLAPDSQLRPVPRLAKTVDISPDQRTITIALRTDVYWHDGYPFTAKDVQFTFATVLDPNYSGVRSASYLDIVGAQDYQRGKTPKIAGIRILGDHKIAFTLQEPYAPFLQALALPLIPEHIFSGWPVGELARHPATQHPVGTGPYRFGDYAADGQVSLVRNDKYYLGKPHIERVIFRVSDSTTALAQLQQGEIDYLEVPPEVAAELRGNTRLRIHETPALGYQYLGVNHRNPWLKDVRVRQAMLYAIDRQAIINNLLGGHGTVVNSHVLPATWAFDAAGLLPYYYNPSTAASLLKEAGFTRDPDGFLRLGGQRFEVTLAYPTGNAVREKSAPLIRDYLEAVGIKVNLEPLELAALVTRVFNDNQADLWLGGWSLSADPDPGPLFMDSNKWGRASGWRNARSDKLLSQGVRWLAPVQRQPIYTEWSRLVNKELPYLFLYAQNNIEVINRRVNGVQADARGLLWNIHELWISA